MEAGQATADNSRDSTRGVPSWVLGLVPLLLIVVALGAFSALSGPGLGDRLGPPAEELAVERTVLEPGRIELTVRNDGPDAVSVAQVVVNDAFASFEGAGEPIGRLATERVVISQPWIEGEAYEVALLTSSGGTITHEIPVAVETPSADAGFYGLMALLGIYVGVNDRDRDALAAVDPAHPAGLAARADGAHRRPARLPRDRRDARGRRARGGGIAGLRRRRARLPRRGGRLPRPHGHQLLAGAAPPRSAAAGASGATLATLIAVGIGLHNLGEGLAIGTAYTTGALALGAFLVVGFALHNTTEGLAIVAPIASTRPSLARLAALGLIAGAPAVLGARIGAWAFNNSVAAFLFGAGAGAIAQVIVQLAPSLRADGEQGLRLTGAGERLALEMMRHHRLLELYLAEHLDVPRDRVHEEADALEHVLSEDLEARIAAKLGNPTHDPHGDPIPDGDLVIDEGHTEALDSLPVGAGGRFVRVSDADPEMLRYLSDLGICVGDELEMVDRQPFGGPCTVRFPQATHVLGLPLCRAMRVSRPEGP